MKHCIAMTDPDGVRTVPGRHPDGSGQHPDGSGWCPDGSGWLLVGPIEPHCAVDARGVCGRI